MAKKADSTTPRNGHLERVGYILPEMLKQLKLGKEFKQRLVLYKWEEIVGRDIAAHAKPVKLEYKRLFIRTTHPAWAEQLKYMSRQLMYKINGFAGERVVEELVFTNLASLYKEAEKNPQSEGHQRSTQADIARELKSIELSPQILEDIHTECSRLQNHKLAVPMEKLGQSLRRLEQYHRSIGWVECAEEGCFSLCPPEDKYCPACLRKRQEEKERSLRRLLYDMPWSTYNDVAGVIECTMSEFRAQRTILLQQLCQKVYYGDEESADAMTLVMLYRSIPPEQLNEQVIKKTLYRLRYDLRYVQGQKRPKSKASLKGQGRKIKGEK